MLDDLFDACRRNDLERVKTLVAADPSLLARHAANGETPFLTACYHRSGAVVEWLMTQAWPRSIHEAAAMDDEIRIRSLLESDPALADTYSLDGWTPLHLAAFFGSPRAAELLLARGANHHLIAKNSMANSPLHAALAARHLPLAQMLLAAGADPALECAGYTPLAIAEGNGFAEGEALIRSALSSRGHA